MMRLNKILVAILLFILSLIPFIIYSKYSVADPFLLQHIAKLISVESATKINFVDIGLSPIQGFGMMILILGNYTGIELQTLQFQIILGPILLLSYYILSREFTKSSTYSLLLVVILAFGFATPYYSVWPHAWGFVLYPLFIYLYYKFLMEKNVSYIILLFIIFVATNYYSYTSEVWMIVFSLLLNFMILIYSYIYKNEVKKYSTENMLVAFIVIFFTFNTIIYNSYLPQIEISAIYESITLFMGPFFGFFANTATESEYIYNTQSPKLLIYTNTLILLLLILPVFLSLIFEVINIFKNKCNLDSVVFVSIKHSVVLVFIFDIMVYALLKILFLRYILFIFPILAVESLTRIKIKNKRQITTLFVCSVLILSAISFYWTWSLDLKNTSKSKYKEFNYGSNWIYSKTDDIYIVSDHYTVSWYQIFFAEKDSSLKASYYSEKDFYYLVDKNWSISNNENFKDRYVVINNKFENHKTWVGGWHDFNPIINYENNIKQNINLNEIYDDNIVSILKG